ncbi:MAG: UDP-2,3-diacylglucosamine diphosphatase [Gammaproteobacteria bacterium]|nr:UDP-2,3-diacylglucosamine diphosphatase [Gammaproteobacteria bacterium]
MMDEYLFISDCHLDENRQEITNHLISFLQNRARKARFLYILGDLFETWIGDDDPAVYSDDVFDILKKLANKTDVFFIPGNRDFLLGEPGSKRLGARLISEPYFITLGEQKVALLHGDSLCTDDTEYQHFRKMVRSHEWQSEFLAKPPGERKHIVSELRMQSKAAIQDKSMDIIDVNQASVVDSFDKLNVDIIIHGHTHKPAIHRYRQHRVRYVLGDWNPHPSFLSWRADRGFELSDQRV